MLQYRSSAASSYAHFIWIFTASIILAWCTLFALLNLHTFCKPRLVDNWNLLNSSTQQSGHAFIKTFHPPNSFFLYHRFWGWWMQRARESQLNLLLSLLDDWELLWRMGSRLNMFLVVLFSSLPLAVLLCGKSTRRHSSFSGSIRLTWCRSFNLLNACDMSASY